jgi:hypothetical protein
MEEEIDISEVHNYIGKFFFTDFSKNIRGDLWWELDYLLFDDLNAVLGLGDEINQNFGFRKKLTESREIK